MLMQSSSGAPSNKNDRKIVGGRNPILRVMSLSDIYECFEASKKREQTELPPQYLQDQRTVLARDRRTPLGEIDPITAQIDFS